MAKLFIANCTKQRQDFVYRLPESPSVRRQTIEIGQQIQIAGDRTGHLSQVDIDAIIDQHRVYGMIEAKERPPQNFIGLCYSIDRPVPATPIAGLIQHNEEVMLDLGRKARQDAALAMNDLAEKNIHEFGNDRDKVKEVEVTITEQAQGHSDRSAKLEEGTVVRRGEGGDNGARGKRGRRAA